jgi:transposase
MEQEVHRRKFRRATQEERTRRAILVGKCYQDGLSIRQIATKTGFSYGQVHTLLLSTNVPLRPRGGYHRYSNDTEETTPS